MMMAMVAIRVVEVKDDSRSLFIGGNHSLRHLKSQPPIYPLPEISQVLSDARAGTRPGVSFLTLWGSTTD